MERSSLLGFCLHNGVMAFLRSHLDILDYFYLDYVKSHLNICGLLLVMAIPVVDFHVREYKIQ